MRAYAQGPPPPWVRIAPQWIALSSHCPLPMRNQIATTLAEAPTCSIASTAPAAASAGSRAQELLRNSRDYGAYLGTPISGTPLATPIPSSRSTPDEFLSRLERAEKRDEEEERSAQASAAVREKVAAAAAAKKLKKKKARKQSSSSSTQQQQQQQQQSHSHSLKRSRATKSMQNLLEADNPVSQPASHREDDERSMARRAAARGVDLKPRVADLERARMLLQEQHQRGRITPPSVLSSPASTPTLSGTPLWGTPLATPLGTPPITPRGQRQGQRHLPLRERRASHERSAWGLGADVVANSVANCALSVADSFGAAARARALSMPMPSSSSSPASSHWSGLAGSILDRVQGTVADAGSYLPAPPIPSTIADVARYLPAPDAVTQALDKATSELGPSVVAYGGVGGIAGGVRVLGAAAANATTEYMR